MNRLEKRQQFLKEFIEKGTQLHNGKYDYSNVDYINSRTKVNIICPKHGLFEQVPRSHLQGNGCPKCAHEWTDEHRLNHCISSRQSRGMTTKEWIDEVQSKTKATNLAKYGVSSAMKLDATLQKVSDSKRKNHTFSTSKPEEIMYQELCNVFGKSDIDRWYNKDVRYPFHVDFYIKSLDLFIELNATWLHGKHWFNPNDKGDINRLNVYVDKVKMGKMFYQSAIDVWTKRDVLKRETAKKNHLKYMVFWNQDLSDFYQWVKKGCQIKNSY